MKIRALLLCILAVTFLLPACAKKTTDITIKKIKYNTGLTELDLSYQHLTDADIEPLQEMANLKKLNLSGNQISNVGPLKDLTKLENLKLWGNPISDWSPVEHIENVGGRPAEDSVVPLEDTSTFVIKGALIQLAKEDNDDKPHYLKADVSISMNNKSKEYGEVIENVTGHKVIINEILINVIEKYTVDNITENKDKIKSVLTAMLRERFETDCIFDVVFGYFLPQ